MEENEIEQFDQSHSDEVRRRRRKRLRTRRLLAVALILLLIWWFNNYTLKTNKVQISSSKISEPVRLVVISDQHATKHGISNRSIVRRIENADPDLVIMLGDMYSSGSSWDLIQIPINLTEDIINAGYEVYFVSGDHDTGAEYKSQIAEVGAHVMNYRSEYLTVNGNKLQILGIDNVYYSSTFDLSTEFTLDPDCYSILMAHIPNYEKFAQFGADLTLCADSHGDMIQLPFGMGPLIDFDTMTFFPRKSGGRTVYDKGFFDYNNGTMFITSGIGVSPVPVRLNNRPEVVVMDIVPE